MKKSIDLFPITVIAAYLMVMLTGCGESCDANKQKEAWKKYDTAVLEANKKRALRTLQTFSNEYATAVDGAIAQRIADLNACHCEQERPSMNDADVAASKANLRRMETKFLINVCTSYNSTSRSVDANGTPKYKTELNGVEVYHPMYTVLSGEAFDSLKTKVTLPIDSTLPDSVVQPITVMTYKKMPVKDVLERFGPFALEEQYRSFYNYDGPNFLADIENFHNDPVNWSRCGLSNTGRNHVLQICKKYELNEGDVIDALNTARVFCGE